MERPRSPCELWLPRPESRWVCHTRSSPIGARSWTKSCRPKCAVSVQSAETLLARVGTYTVGDNLIWFASIVLNSPAASLAQELHADDQRLESASRVAERTGLTPASFPAVLADYLTAEQRVGRVRDNIDGEAFGFLIAGALHNLLIAGPAWRRPEQRQLEHYLTAAAGAIAKESQGPRSREHNLDPQES